MDLTDDLIEKFSGILEENGVFDPVFFYKDPREKRNILIKILSQIALIVKEIPS